MAKSPHDPHNMLADEIERSPSQSEGEVLDTEVKTNDAVFGNITDDGPNYRNVSCCCGNWHCFPHIQVY